jgi:hypothetical protein
MVFPSLSRQKSGSFFKIVHKCFLPRPCQFIIYVGLHIDSQFTAKECRQLKKSLNKWRMNQSLMSCRPTMCVEHRSENISCNGLKARPKSSGFTFSFNETLNREDSMPFVGELPALSCRDLCPELLCLQFTRHSKGGRRVKVTFVDFTVQSLWCQCIQNQ